VHIDDPLRATSPLTSPAVVSRRAGRVHESLDSDPPRAAADSYNPLRAAVAVADPLRFAATSGTSHRYAGAALPRGAAPSPLSGASTLVGSNRGLAAAAGMPQSAPSSRVGGGAAPTSATDSFVVRSPLWHE
jgi:hypothetical protein